MAPPADRQAPRVLVADAAHLALVTAVLAQHGWEVHARIVRNDDDARSTVISAARAEAVVAIVDTDQQLATRLRDDLARIGHLVDLRIALPALDLSLVQLNLLVALADGLSLKGAALSLGISERTASRRVAAARTTLNVPSTTEAALAASALIEILMGERPRRGGR